MSKWIAEFELEDGDTMPEHMELNYMGANIDFHCRPKEPVLDKIRAEIEQITDTMGVSYNQYVSKIDVLNIIDKYKEESEE